MRLARGNSTSVLDFFIKICVEIIFEIIKQLDRYYESWREEKVYNLQDFRCVGQVSMSEGLVDYQVPNTLTLIELSPLT